MLDCFVRFILTKPLAFCWLLVGDAARAVDSCSKQGSFPEAPWRRVLRTDNDRLRLRRDVNTKTLKLN